MSADETPNLSGRAVVVGASHAGVAVSAALRRQGWVGDIVLVGDEGAPPYQRPPLSKSMLQGDVELPDMAIRSTGFYRQQRIDIRHARATQLDLSARRLTLDDGDTLGYDALALCVGARARRLDVDGAHLDGVHYLRDAADAARIRSALADARRAVVVGAGYLGLEIAASLRALGKDVTVLETAGRVLQRVTAAPVSAFYDRVHRAAGVTLRTGVTVAAIEGRDRAHAVRLGTGESVEADIVIVGVGVEPNTELARDAGLTVDDGIVTDCDARTDDPRVVAAGDCANPYRPRFGRRQRLESVPNANDYAKIAAATMCGRAHRGDALPWFWSDQYDITLQIAGMSHGFDDAVVRGDPTRGRSLTCFYLRDGQLAGADCINRPADFAFARATIDQQLPVSADRLADESTPLAV